MNAKAACSILFGLSLFFIYSATTTATAQPPNSGKKTSAVLPNSVNKISSQPTNSLNHTSIEPTKSVNHPSIEPTNSGNHPSIESTKSVNHAPTEPTKSGNHTSSWLTGDFMNNLISIIGGDGNLQPMIQKLIMSSGQSFSSEQIKKIQGASQAMFSGQNGTSSGFSSLFRNIFQLIGSFKQNKTQIEDRLDAIQQLCKEVESHLSNGGAMDVTLGDFIKPFTNVSLPEAIANNTLTGVYKFCQLNYSQSMWPQCQHDLQTFVTDLMKGKPWTFPMIDSSGKPGNGLLRGNLRFLSNYKQCQNVSYQYPNSTSKIEGNVCRLYVKIPLDFKLPGIIWSIAADRRGTSNLITYKPGKDIYLEWDVCFPKTCLDSDMQLYLAENLIQDVYVKCTATDLDVGRDWSAIMAISILSFFGFMMLVGTLLEVWMAQTSNSSDEGNSTWNNVYGKLKNDGNGRINPGASYEESTIELSSKTDRKREDTIMYDGTNTYQMQGNNGVTIPPPDYEDTAKPEEKKPRIPAWKGVLLAFSIPRNTEKILSFKSSPGAIGCLHGIRVLSLAWVIIGHIVLYQTSGGQFQNKLDAIDGVQTLAGQIILNAPLAVDSFFVLSGLLTCYTFMKHLGKKGRITIKQFVMYYVHRYVRLTPSMAIWVMIVACLLKYIGEGRPAWKDYEGAKNCRNNWWANLLYINNIYKQDEICIGVSWFISTDMQFYIVAPLALIPWVYGKKIIGFIIAAGLVAVHFASNLWLQIKYNADGYANNPIDYSNYIYFRPYTRVAPYALGLMVGWVLWKTKCQVRMNKYLVLLMWLLSFGCLLVFSLASYTQNRDMSNEAYVWNITERTAFMTLYRVLWAVACAWMMFACATGYGGYINSILAWDGWLPLSRLTYSAFIVHLTIIFYEGTNPEYDILVTTTSVSYMFFGYYVMAYAVAYILTVSVESPTMALEKIMFG